MYDTIDETSVNPTKLSLVVSQWDCFMIMKTSWLFVCSSTLCRYKAQLIADLYCRGWSHKWLGCCNSKPFSIRETRSIVRHEASKGQSSNSSVSASVLVTVLLDREDKLWKMKAWIEWGWSALLGLVKILGPGKEISREQRTPDHRILSLYSAGQRGERSTGAVDEISRNIFTILQECLV